MTRVPRPLLECLVAMGAGLGLFGLMAALEIHFKTGLLASALLEESGKALLILVFGWLGMRVRTGSAQSEASPARRKRALFLGAAHGLSLGLLATAVFIGAENLDYLIAFPEAGVLERLLWSAPVHLVAALTEALGSIVLLRSLEMRGWRRLARLALWLGTFLLAWGWHAGANQLVSRELSPTVLGAGIVIANVFFLVLLARFLRHAYVGGFLYGAD
jgi:hypothetical protein